MSFLRLKQSRRNGQAFFILSNIFSDLIPPRRYEEMDPTRFKVGDIVQAQISFVGVPLKGGKAKMMMVRSSRRSRRQPAL